MSRESLQWLNDNTLIGFTDKRGKAWHYRADLQAGEPNHYPGPIPVADVEHRLFHWEALAEPVYLRNGVRLPDHKAMVRSDTGHVMAVVTDSYTPHPYKQWLIESIASLLDDDLAIGSAGLLRKGAVAWVSVEVPETVTTPEGVAFRPHLFGATSFDESLATTYKRAITNIVCDNTLGVGLGERGQQVRVRHSARSQLRIGAARQVLNIIYQVADDFAEQIRQLCQVEVTDAQWQRFLDLHAELPADDGKSRKRSLAEKKRNTLTSLWRNDMRVAPWANTAYGVVQAVNTYAHHEQTVRGVTHRAERNMLRAIAGDFDTLDQTTLTQLENVLERPILTLAA